MGQGDGQQRGGRHLTFISHRSISMAVCNPSSEVKEVAGFMGKITNSILVMLSLRYWGHLDRVICQERRKRGGSGCQGRF